MTEFVLMFWDNWVILILITVGSNIISTKLFFFLCLFIIEEKFNMQRACGHLDICNDTQKKLSQNFFQTNDWFEFIFDFSKFMHSFCKTFCLIFISL